MYYPFALVHYILRDIDPHVRLGLLYDIGCNFEAYFVKRNLLSKERAEKRLKIGVAVFHAYAHNWLCQMRYNPRIATGFALTDGENDGNVCEEELRAEWERQKKAQSAEGEIESAAERSRKYEKLGELIFLWDRMKPLLEALKDAVKANDMSRCYVRVALSGVYNQATGCPSILSPA
ncbi:hypothetical protein C349_06858 [Cryptococcus neoformans var. grubii Br795]|nr:hypothetical protein AYX14_06953 [Cryptococcus neoformans var. grubii]OXG71962.1 hypothetical protein C349_06858 [Cryptococcus neoformans var. grubii Br795]OXL05154.1 hypothetical protein C348_06709 [Cryptococcus neoformans var. grubii Gb118]